MINTTSDVANDTKTLVALYRHECTRVIADRFINYDDLNWFDKSIKQVSLVH